MPVQEYHILRRYLFPQKTIIVVETPLAPHPAHRLQIFIVSPAFHCGGNARVMKRTRPVPDSCVSMEAFSARVSAPVFDDLCVHLDLPRVYKCEMVSFQLMPTKNCARFTFTSGNSDIVSKFFSACGNARVETLQWKRFYVFLC